MRLIAFPAARGAALSPAAKTTYTDTMLFAKSSYQDAAPPQLFRDLDLEEPGDTFREKLAPCTHVQSCWNTGST
jgi:hypothetical protein